ncbi:MAG: trypsin-like peptidase domain-containing protein [Chloroflexi bacterium]|nr:trypsin-like peptidase domain-containing protein [Chloroflexota bacterium]
MARVLSDISDALAATVAEAAPAVVRVESRRRLPASGIVWSADGVLVTAHHVIDRDENIRVGLADTRTVQAVLVGRDPTTDLAVLRAEASGLAAPVWAESDGLRVGHMALSLGRPGETIRAALGVVSALGGAWVTPAGGRLDRYLQTDVAPYPGFSGGPLVAVDARILGLNTSAFLRSISITVPSLTVRRVVETLLAHGRMRRGYLGVGIQPVRLPPPLAQQVSQETGLLVVNVASGSPAEQARLLLGDVILALSGQPVRFLDDLMTILSGTQVGGVVPVTVIRAGRVRELNVKIGEHP